MSELELRISDVDRERAAAVLHAAVGEGRLTWPEHEERLAGVYAARTGTELAPWLADLPIRASVTSVVTPPLRVTLGKVRRRPDPGAGRVTVDVVLGAAIIDLRDLPAGALVDVVANSLLGKVEVHVSPGTRLLDTGTAMLGKRSTQATRRAHVVPRPDAPMVRISGHSVLGHVRVHIGSDGPEIQS